MTVAITIVGQKSLLESNFHPSLNLDEKYECGLLYFSATNSVTNINSTNNIFCYGDEGKELQIPFGAYDLLDIERYLARNLNDCTIELIPNNNTLKCSIFCSKTIHFEKENSIGRLLGFGKAKLEANKWHDSESLVNILSLSVIRIECDLIQGSYHNGLPTHTIYEFIPNVPPGHRYIEVPSNIIYYPINRLNISSVSIKIVDDCGKLIDFRKEHLQLRLHLRKIT